MEGHRDICLAHSGGGWAIKGNDKDGIPLCHGCHSDEHKGHNTFRNMLEMQTGKTWEEHAEETYNRYLGMQNGH